MTKPLKTIYFTLLESQLGEVLLAGDEEGLRQISFMAGNSPHLPGEDWIESREPLWEAREQIGAYFRGERKTFDLPLAPEGTPFQQTVWNALREIPYGRTITYGELARRIGQPTASRAVGAANGRNPLPIIVPCHRVIGSNGELTGFRGGIHLKAGLLELEQRHGDGPVQDSLF